MPAKLNGVEHADSPWNVAGILGNIKHQLSIGSELIKLTATCIISDIVLKTMAVKRDTAPRLRTSTAAPVRDKSFVDRRGFLDEFNVQVPPFTLAQFKRFSRGKDFARFRQVTGPGAGAQEKRDSNSKFHLSTKHNTLKLRHS